MAPRARRRRRSPRPLISVPRPIATPRRGLTFSPSIVVFALLTVAVSPSVRYLAVQLLRFAKPPTIAVNDPATAVVEVDEADDLLRPARAVRARARDSTATPGRDPYTLSADADGAWATDVDLRRGRNQFEVSALDPDTGKRSESSVALLITVPFLEIEAPTLSVDQPAEGATYENGAIPVQGRATNATSVVVSAIYTGPGRRARRATARRRPRPPAAPPPMTVPVADDGTYARRSSSRPGIGPSPSPPRTPRARPTSLTRNVTVAYQGVTVAVDDQGRPGLAQGLGRRQGGRRDRDGRQGLLIGQGR